VKWGKKIDILIKDEEGTTLPSRLDFLVSASHEPRATGLLCASRYKLFSPSGPQEVSPATQGFTRGWIRQMTADETVIMSIPTRREDTSTNTPNVFKILGINGRGLRARVLFPRRTRGRSVRLATCRQVALYRRNGEG
jgi:hypothetical protein